MFQIRCSDMGANEVLCV